ncbi:platelet glycoprotein IX-like [Seriola lalandi dorsalis]|uniref:Platelet glycoprotein IX-like n=1 Tax=Seriola lalandi dorsalis TaxID=1841481 RepID=A0A3B4XEQ4_SERLL|nr:platelet glycoprotein IX-like [Seriola lalandi dorsalis]
MLPGLSLAVFLLMATASAHTFGQPRLCSLLLSTGLKMNCSSLSLMELPLNTIELHVEDSQLTSVSPGLFDRLVGLKKVSLYGNPFHCDCRIQYLRNWLLKNRDIVLKKPMCASPSSVAQRAITELSDDYFSSCVLTRCTGGTYNTLVGLILCCIIALLLWSLTLAKTSTYTLSIDKRHTGFEANSLRSLKPKHRRRLNTNLSLHSSTEDLERPLINMELLPQVLDVLNKKHNIKIKAT